MSEISPLLARLEVATAKLEALAASGKLNSSSSASAVEVESGDVSAMVTAFDETVSPILAKFVAAAVTIGGEAAEHAKLVNTAFLNLKELLIVASKSKAPAASDIPSILKPLCDSVALVADFTSLKANFKTKTPTHLKTVSESIPALLWVQVTPKPAPYVKEMADAGEFYCNRVLKDFKDVAPVHVDWCKAFKELWVTLQTYVKTYHTTGLVWNPKGGKAVVPAGPSAAAEPNAAAPAASTPVINTGAPSGNLFSELNKGGSVTGGLKKVDKSQMTHKNPELRASSVVKADAITAAPKKTPASAGTVKKGTPKFELDGKKWAVEWQENNSNIVIEESNISQVLYIYKCSNSVIKVNEKINTITMDSCKKVALVFESAVASCEVVNCQSVQIQILDKVPTVNIDKTDGIQVYLSANGLNTQFVTAKSSEMNISIPGNKPEDDMVESPVPEQYLTVYEPSTGKFKTTTLESLG